MQLICALVIALTSVLHVDASFASQAKSTSILMMQDDDQGGDVEKVVPERCDFCSGTVSTANVLTPLDRGPVRQVVPSGVVRRLLTVSLPTTAPPPRS